MPAVRAGGDGNRGRHRHRDPGVSQSRRSDGVIVTDKLTLRYREGSGPFTASNTSITLGAPGRQVTAHPSWPAPPGRCEFGTACQAEDGRINGGESVNYDHGGFAGRGFTADYGQVSASDGWTVTGVPADGDYALQVRYANGGTVARTLSASVDDTAAGSLSLPPTGDWDTWGVTTLAVHLKAGTNTVSTMCAADDGCNVNLDSVALTTPGAGYPTRSTTTPGNWAGGRAASMPTPTRPAPTSMPSSCTRASSTGGAGRCSTTPTRRCAPMTAGPGRAQTARAPTRTATSSATAVTTSRRSATCAPSPGPPTCCPNGPSGSGSRNSSRTRRTTTRTS